MSKNMTKEQYQKWNDTADKFMANKKGIGYEITMEYIESNEANPEEVGLNYVSIYKTDSDDDELVEVGRTWR